MTSSTASKSRRIEWIDLARGLALTAMATYHFGWDLEFFGYLEPGTAGTGVMKWYARGIASSFLFLVGISLILAHGNGVRWNGFGKRLIMVAAAALAITIATRFATPDSYVFFGILHQIAVASVLGLAFMRLPAITLLAVALVWFAVPALAKSDIFAHPLLLWIGLSPIPPHSNDFVPVFPWFAAVLAGMAAGRIMAETGFLDRLREHPPGSGAISRGLQFLGRHSLITYLVHQPLLIACVYLFSLVSPPAQEENFVQSCIVACAKQSSEQACTAFCGCTANHLIDEGLFEGVLRGQISQDSNPAVAGIVAQCSIEAGINGN